MVDRVSKAFEKLTPREREILRLIAAHLQSKEIARALGLSPKTVEMHVLSARRRLSGLSRRDAALAFVAWEGGDPGNDYRKRPSDLAALPDPPLSDREIGSGHERTTQPEPDIQKANQAGRFGGGWGLAAAPDVAGRSVEPARVDVRRGGLAEGSGEWRAAFHDLVAGSGDDVSHARPAARRDWRHEMSNLQWLGLVLGITALTAVLLAVIAIGVHEFIMAVQRITHR
ncbi:helix-turn-helix transcriptional regulator [Caulobacter sp. 1776]|uniref:helix-turn-helix transcriptional regulator n=1 Tax=Caulobacter sp. 1776 TaxID=3156420 RepID=UPI0033989171